MWCAIGLAIVLEKRNNIFSIRTQNYSAPRPVRAKLFYGGYSLFTYGIERHCLGACSKDSVKDRSLMESVA